MPPTACPRLLFAALLAIGLAACDSPTAPEPVFTFSGNGNTVFQVPGRVTRARITGSFSGNSSNFIVWIGNTGAGCGTVAHVSCRLLVNELLGTLQGPLSYDGTVQTGGGGEATVKDSSGVAWTFTEVK